MSILMDISAGLQKGRAKVVKELVEQAVAEGLPAKQILDDGLLHGMNIVGQKFKINELYVPDVLVAARAMNAGTEILKPMLMESGVEATGKVVLGTCKGDLHDIGKNLVKMMMEGKGLEVVDLGVDVSAEKFVDAAIENEADILACSALLTTTMGEMGNVVKIAEEKGVRSKFTIMVGGAPVNESFRESVGADIYAPDAASAADEAVAVVEG